MAKSDEQSNVSLRGYIVVELLTPYYFPFFFNNDITYRNSNYEMKI